MRDDDTPPEGKGEETRPQDGTDLEALRREYRAEQDRLCGQRIPITAGIYVFMIGIAIGVESILFPERRLTAWLFYAAHVLGSAFWLGFAAFRVSRGDLGGGASV